MDENQETQVENPEVVEEVQPELPTEETPQEPEVKEEPVDLDAIKAELSSEYERQLEEKVKENQRDTVERLSKAFGLEPTEGDEKPVYNEGDDVGEYVEKVADWRERERQRAEEERIKEDRLRVDQEREQFNASTVAGWNAQMAEMQEEGLLPEVVDPNKEDDPGVKARVELLSGLNAYNEERVAAGKERTFNLWEAHYKSERSQTSDGADAPVIGSSPKAAGTSDSEYSYEEIRKARSAEDLI